MDMNIAGRTAMEIDFQETFNRSSERHCTNCANLGDNLNCKLKKCNFTPEPEQQIRKDHA